MTALTVATGRSTFQPKRISWSYRSRGTDARIQMKTDTNTKTLRRNQSGPSGAYGPCQPPKKSVTASPESVMRLMYSAVWKRPQRMPPYSVWKPATSSVSASGRSNGGRLVSAIIAKKNTSSPANCGMKNQIVAPCLLTMSTRFSDWPIRTTPSTDSASDTSYETSCAHVRIEPSREYFDSEAQPPTIGPYTPIDPSAKIRIRAIETFAISPLTCQCQIFQPAPNGITAKAASAVNIEMIGAAM